MIQQTIEMFLGMSILWTFFYIKPSQKTDDWSVLFRLPV